LYTFFVKGAWEVRRTLEIIFSVLGSAILALVVGLILAGIAASGVISLRLTHALFWAALVISALGASLAVQFASHSPKYSLSAFVITAVIVGAGLLWINRWIEQEKNRQASEDKPPSQPVALPAKPNIPTVKTPKPSGPITKVDQTGKGNGAVSGGITAGPCSNILVGGNNNQATTNCSPPAPPDRTLSDQAAIDFRAALTVEGMSRPLVGIEIVGGDADMPAFPNQIVDAFTKAGWKVNLKETGSKQVTVLTDRGMVVDHGEGLHCGASDKDNPVVKQALDAFRKAGHPCAMNGVSPFPQNGEILAVEIGPRVRSD
jgi:hypothetical protein